MFLLAVSCTDEAPPGQADRTPSVGDSTVPDSGGGPGVETADTGGSTDTATTEAPSLEDRFAVAIDVTDVLWVVDDSASMGPEQAEVAQNGPSFFDALLGSGIDYHVGVVSTDMDDPSRSGQLVSEAGVRWIDEDTPDAIGVFDAMVSLGTSGSGNEQGREAAYTALDPLAQPGAPNDGFLRDTACTTVIVVSDEPDLSGDDVITAAGWTSWLLAREATIGPVSHHLLAPPKGPGTAYVDVTSAVGGVVLDLESDPATALETLGLASQCQAPRSFVLAQEADPASIAVTVERGKDAVALDEGSDWSYDAKARAVVLAQPTLVAHGDVVVVAYDPP